MTTTITKRTILLSMLLGAAAWLTPSATAQEGALDAGEVLDRARAAIGWERVAAHAGSVRVRGAARVRGTDAEQTDHFDGRGRRQQVLEGPLPMSSGFDGHTTWAVDWTGTPRVLELGDGLAAHLSAAFLYGSWTEASAGLEFPSATEENGQVTLAFVHGSGLLEGVVHLDGTSWLPRGARLENGGRVSTWTFEDLRDHDGYRFPQQIAIEQEGLVQRLSTREVEFLEAVDEALFAPRLELPGDTHFDPDLGSEIEVRRVRTGHLLVHPSVDGEDLGWFIFDTGAGTNCISTAVAERLASGPFGEIPAQGIGGTVPASFWRAEELRLGPVAIDDPVFMAIDLAFLSGPFGVEVGGILGYELLSRCAVEFDMAAATIALFDPATYELSPDGYWEEAVLSGRLPAVRATFEGHEGVFTIDTGAAGSTVTMHSPVVRELGLIEGRETTAGSMGGVGGMVPVRMGQLASFELGGHEFGAIPASFATQEEGLMANPHVAGNLGGRLLEPFLLIFDYPHKRLGFVPK